MQKAGVSRLSGGDWKVRRYVLGDGWVQIMLPLGSIGRRKRAGIGAMIGLSGITSKTRTKWVVRPYKVE